MTATPAASLAWTQDPDLMAAWDAAVAAIPQLDHVGDTGADHGPIDEPLSGSDADRRADVEENVRWRRLP